MREEWNEHRRPIAEEISEHERKLAQMDALRGDIKAKTSELAEREELALKLTERLAKMPPAASRASYTRRIFEIVKNVQKQKVEINKILHDVREIQKEMNIESQRLGRSFGAASEVVWRAAEKNDPASQKCYKALADMHSVFQHLVNTVQEMANTDNATRDLQMQIDELNEQNLAGAIDQIITDLNELRAANWQLAPDSSPELPCCP